MTRPTQGTVPTHEDQIIATRPRCLSRSRRRLDATGETVTLLSTCDWQGQSPANIGVDARGKQFLTTFDEVTVTDSPRGPESGRRLDPRRPRGPPRVHRRVIGRSRRQAGSGSRLRRAVAAFRPV
jgi:hypothetical protein